MDIPKKIYIFEYELQREDHVVRYGVNQDKGIEGLIEYTRTDAFVEKAEEFIYSALNDGIMGTANIEDFMRLFRKYIKGE